MSSTTTTATGEHSVVAVYESHTVAAAALDALRSARLDDTDLALLDQEDSPEDPPVELQTARQRMGLYGLRGAVWGSLWGMLLSSLLGLVPAVGRIVASAPLAGWLAGTLASAWIGALVGLAWSRVVTNAIPDGSVRAYLRDLRDGKVLVLARGCAGAIARAREVLGTTGASRLQAHTVQV